ncbi:MAG: alpha/beta hydrolase family protein [Acidobacteriota bacterium]
MQQQKSRRDFLSHSTALIGAGFGLSITGASSTPAYRAPREFAAFQQDRRRELWNLLGDLPQAVKPRRTQTIKTEKHDGYTLESLILDLNGIEPVPALLLIPDKRQPKAPGLLYIHAHGGTYNLGSEELIEGRDILMPYAPLCAEMGLVTLAIDSWCFGKRRHTDDGEQEEMDAFKRLLWQGKSLWGMMLFDELQAVSYLRSRQEVDPARIGTFGLSMGSLKSWWLAALDPRISLCVDLCCLTDYRELIKAETLNGYGIYSHVPNLLKHFQSAEINELIVPRPHLSLNGRRDSLAPAAGVIRIRDHLLPRYERYGQKEDCRIELFDCGHEETPEMRAIVIEWFDKYLAGGTAA